MFRLIIFFHIISAITLFVTWALEYVQTIEMARFTLKDIEGNISWKKYKLTRRYNMLVMLVALATGIWLMVAFWGHSFWMMMSMILLLLIILAGLLLSKKRSSVKKVRDYSISLLLYSVRIRIALGAGIVALMVFKPVKLQYAALIACISLLAGIIWAFGLQKTINR